MPYEPTWESVRQHPVPDWFHNAKLGIFIHWGLYSVPAWAPLTGELGKVVEEQGWGAWFARNPYAEWYLNSIRVPGSVSRQYHVETYGESFAYDDFVPVFNEAVEQWDPAAWASLFRQVGAQYVVLTTKHHDGFLLWPSRRPNPFKGGYHARRDLVGELSAAVRAEAMRMALYYSGGLDWTFNDTVIANITDIMRAVPQQSEYVAYADAHWLELIDRYAPVVLWNDIAYPAASDLPRLFSHYYNTVPEGLINNRFTQSFEIGAEGAEIMGGKHFDFTTPEYATHYTYTESKWEATRGIGFSFGYNRNEGPDAYLSVPELVRSFVDIVSKNGNLLLNVGPMADGTIPTLQRERLEALGAWLRVHSEAIFDTRPWHRVEGLCVSPAGVDLPVRFTQKAGTPDTPEGTVYATVLATPAPGVVVLKGLGATAGTRVSLLGGPGSLSWQQVEAGLRVTVPDPLPDALAGAPAWTLAMTPQPEPAG
jgi:alpha-L-fucosidase